ncbi:hypothetical protein H0H93_002715, partial [Arthromyces matolae]
DQDAGGRKQDSGPRYHSQPYPPARNDGYDDGFQMNHDESMSRKRRDSRPEMRRPGSLLERLEMPVDRNYPLEASSSSSFPRSLSDRVEVQGQVHVPSKRDRDEMTGYNRNPEFRGSDEQDPAMKRARKRTPRGRRGKLAQQS